MATNQYMVFGYDARDALKLWRAAWRDFLLGDDSPVRRRLDEMVTLATADGDTVWQAGRQTDHPAVPARAIALPEELVLNRTLTLPAAADIDLDSVIALEVSAHSPFAADDTAFGRRVQRRESGELEVGIGVVARSAVMTWLGQHHDLHDPDAVEVWVPVDGGYAVLQGFGEHRREAAYHRRLRRVGLLIAVAAVLLLGIAGVSTALARAELAKLESLQAQVQTDAAAVSELREQLADANATVDVLNKLTWLYPNPHVELGRFSALVPDDAFVTQFTMNGREVRIRGRGRDGAGLLQTLTARREFKSVNAPQAITRVGNTGFEQFFIDISLGGQAQ